MKHEYNENEESVITSLLMNEYATSKANRSGDMDDFEASIDLFNNEESVGDIEAWESNIPIPEFASQMLTQTSMDVGQYFQTRDFVETYIQDPSDEALLAADASEECLNRTLNRRDLYHYQKFVRGKTMSNIGGEVWAECGWEQSINEDGEPVRDQFWYDILDPRNVFTDNKYVYSVQQKDYIIVRKERTLQKLKTEQDREGYINLKLLEDIQASGDTETKRDTLDRDSGTHNTPDNKISEYFDIYKRYGMSWIMPNGKPGIDEYGEIKEKAELKECVTIVAQSGSTRFLIGFHEQPYEDALDNKYRPVIRGICYIHPTKDGGVGDGHYAQPLAVAINDTFNVSNNRTLLATQPTMKGKKYVTDDTDTIRIAPDHLIELNDPDDLQEMVFQDNTAAAMNQLGLLFNKMQQTTSMYPNVMGGASSGSDTTATEIVGADNRANQRSNYKSLTFEYTFLNELYWMIQQMTWNYAYPETGYKLMGEKVMNFNPTMDFFYKPLSQSIESAESKNAKIKQWTTILQSIVTSPHPDMPIMFNYIMAQVVVLMGDEYANFANKLLGTDQPMQEGNTGSAPTGEGQAVSNQNMIPQSSTEVMAREGMRA